MELELILDQTCLWLQDICEVDKVLIHYETFLSLICIHRWKFLKSFCHKNEKHFVYLQEILEQEENNIRANPSAFTKVLILK